MTKVWHIPSGIDIDDPAAAGAALGASVANKLIDEINNPCPLGHRYEVQWQCAPSDGVREYDILCLRCGECRTVRPA